MEVVFVTPEGLRLDVELWYFDTALEMKEKIQRYYGIPVICQRLILGDEVMQDSRDTAYYGIEVGSEIGLEVITRAAWLETAPDQEGMMVIKLRHGTREVGLQVFHSDAVQVLRGKIMAVMEIRNQLDLPPRSQQGPYKLLFGSKVLHEKRSFHLHGIQHGDVVEVHHGRRELVGSASSSRAICK